MRYVRWIIILLVLLFLILELAYNFQVSSQTFKFVIWVPGRTLATLEMEIWIGMLVTFALGFGLAIFFELYYWGKYALTIRKQDQVIEELKKKVAALEAPATPEVQPPTVQDQS